MTHEGPAEGEAQAERTKAKSSIYASWTLGFGLRALGDRPRSSVTRGRGGLEPSTPPYDTISRSVESSAPREWTDALILNEKPVVIETRK